MAETRSLVFQDEKSHKFWKITLADTSYTVNYGRVGTTGQTKTKEYDTPEEAKKAYDKLVAEKEKKGYVEAEDEHDGG